MPSGSGKSFPSSCPSRPYKSTWLHGQGLSELSLLQAEQSQLPQPVLPRGMLQCLQVLGWKSIPQGPVRSRWQGRAVLGAVTAVGAAGSCQPGRGPPSTALSTGTGAVPRVRQGLGASEKSGLVLSRGPGQGWLDANIQVQEGDVAVQVRGD